MVKRVIYLFLMAGFLLSVASCSQYNKIAHGSDMNKKYELAISSYQHGDYTKALPLFEELMSVYRGTAKADSIYYYYAYTNYNLGYFTLAAYEFKNFTETYPKSPHAEECAYMHAYCYYLNSPEYSLDQADTRKAINAFQTFIDDYPNSTRITKCNELIDKLRGKLEKKEYEIDKQYYEMGYYKSAVYAFKNTIKEYPDCKYVEEMSYLTIKSNYLYAINSIESKKAERLQATIDAYHKFIDKYPKSSYLDRAESIYDSALKMKQNIKNNTTKS